MVWAKRAGLGIALSALLVGIAVFLWTTLPVTVDRDTPDPAIQALNARTAGAAVYREAYFEHAGHSLHYVDGGAGDAIVFIHGFPSFWYSFARQMEHFSEDHRVIAIDGLGAGKSDAPAEIEAYTLEAMSAHLAALLDHLGEDRVHLVGHDWGSAFAIGFAQRYPDRVLSVTGISAPAINASLYALETDTKARESAEYVEQFKQANPALLVMFRAQDRIYDGAYRPLVDDGKLTSEEGTLFRNATGDMKRINAHINWYRANFPHPDEVKESDFWPSRDARVTAPALYIWGEEDPIYNKATMQRLTALSDRPSVLRFPKVGHWPHVRLSDEVNAAIAEHIASTQQAGAD